MVQTFAQQRPANFGDFAEDGQTSSIHGMLI
jgi:hypothetical protein